MLPDRSDDDIEGQEKRDERFDDVPEAAGGAISQQFQEAALRIVVQRNDFLLPSLIDMMQVRKTIEVSPPYERRLRWDRTRKSKLIESFLVNIPVPPVFLYEADFARYEVMDGQQRMATLLEFYENQFALTGMEVLTSLNGLRYHEIPSNVRAGLDRRSLSAIILLKESTPSTDTATLLRQKVFERLNTGGVRLNAQEIRNCVHAGAFNDLLIQLSRNPIFAEAWDIPDGSDARHPGRALSRNALYRRMGDVELVLRVIALLDPTNLGSGMKATLDNAMTRLSRRSATELQMLRSQFESALSLAHAIGGADIFRTPSRQAGRRGRPSASLYDAIMVALIRLRDHESRIRQSGPTILDSLRRELGNPQFRDMVVGRANTKEATEERSRYVERLVLRVIDDASR